MTRIFHWFFFMFKMDPMSGFDIRLVFTLPPRDSTLQYKRCVHFWNNFPCITSSPLCLTSKKCASHFCRESENENKHFNRQIFILIQVWLDKSTFVFARKVPRIYAYILFKGSRQKPNLIKLIVLQTQFFYSKIEKIVTYIYAELVMYNLLIIMYRMSKRKWNLRMMCTWPLVEERWVKVIKYIVHRSTGTVDYMYFTREQLNICTVHGEQLNRCTIQGEQLNIRIVQGKHLNMSTVQRINWICVLYKGTAEFMCFTWRTAEHVYCTGRTADYMYCTRETAYLSIVQEKQLI